MKFKEGDHVRVIAGSGALNKEWVGATGQLVEPVEKGIYYPYRIQFDVPVSGQRTLALHENEIELRDVPDDLPNIVVFEERSIIVHVGVGQRLKLTVGEAEALRVRLGQVL